MFTLPTAVSQDVEYEDFYESTLSQPLGISDTDIYPDTMPASTDSFLVIDPDGTNPEVIYFNSVGANYVRCPSATNGEGRGVFNTDPQDWDSGTKIGMYSTAAFFEAIVTGKAMRDNFLESRHYSNVNPAPAGMLAPYAGTSAPTGWLLAFGQTVSRTTYADLFAAIGTTYGAGDGSTTFVLPDLRGRVVAGQDDMGGTSANRLTGASGGVDGDTLGAVGGAETHTLTTAQIASHQHANLIGIDLGTGGSLYTTLTAAARKGETDTAPGNAIGNSGSTGGGGAHNNVQPTIILNYIIKT